MNVRPVVALLLIGILAVAGCASPEETAPASTPGRFDIYGQGSCSVGSRDYASDSVVIAYVSGSEVGRTQLGELVRFSRRQNPEGHDEGAGLLVSHCRFEFDLPAMPSELDEVELVVLGRSFTKRDGLSYDHMTGQLTFRDGGLP